jgi:hypothetical protein
MTKPLRSPAAAGIQARVSPVVSPLPRILEARVGPGSRGGGRGACGWGLWSFTFLRELFLCCFGFFRGSILWSLRLDWGGLPHGW